LFENVNKLVHHLLLHCTSALDALEALSAPQQESSIEHVSVVPMACVQQEYLCSLCQQILPCDHKW
jgi:hypothetical protein